MNEISMNAELVQAVEDGRKELMHIPLDLQPKFKVESFFVLGYRAYLKGPPVGRNVAGDMLYREYSTRCPYGRQGTYQRHRHNHRVYRYSGGACEGDYL